MTLISYIVLALALGIQAFVALRNSAAAHPMRLTRGVLVSVLLALVFAALLAGGMTVGEMLRLDVPQVDKSIALGLFGVVVVKQLFSLRASVTTGYDIQRLGAAIVVALALGINALLLGMGVGFVANLSADWLKMALPLLLLVSLMGTWGIMLGRKQVDIRPRRWLYISMLCLLVVAVVACLV